MSDDTIDTETDPNAVPITLNGKQITARKGEFRIKDVTDFTEVPRDRLEKAVAAFQSALRRG